MSVRRWTPEALDKLSQMYWAGYTNTEIADEFDCKVRRISDALTNYGIAVRSMAYERKLVTMARKEAPRVYRKPTPLPRMNCPTAEPKSRKLDYMDAIEHNLCLWMDGKLKCCGRDRRVGSRYCQHHYERSLKQNEVTND